MSERTRDAIQKALFEAFFVVLAVALALAVNEWRQNRVDRQRARSALASVMEELKTNRSAVQESLENYANLAVIIGTFSHREKQLVEFCDQTLVSLGESPPTGQ